MSTPERSAFSAATASGRTLKPTIIALDASASITSDSLIAPTALWITFTLTSSFESFSSDCLTASAEPCTSALTIIWSSLISPSFIWSKRLSRVTLVCALKISSFLAAFLWSTRVLARRSSETASKISPPTGTSSRPVISTGTEGPASVTLSPLSFVITLTRPTQVPAMIVSPLWSVPFWTSTVAIGPLPLSSLASITVPFAALSGLALSSFISATRVTISRRSSRPSFVFAETGIHGVSPPHSSGISSYSVSCCLTFSGFAPTLSILLMATITDTPAAFAWWIASTVCGMIPSSAATTRIAISVTWAPLARIVVNASCPGVSRNVTGLPFTITL